MQKKRSKNDHKSTPKTHSESHEEPPKQPGGLHHRPNVGLVNLFFSQTKRAIITRF